MDFGIVLAKGSKSIAFGFDSKDAVIAITDHRAAIIINIIAWFSLRFMPALAGFFIEKRR